MKNLLNWVICIVSFIIGTAAFGYIFRWRTPAPSPTVTASDQQTISELEVRIIQLQEQINGVRERQDGNHEERILLLEQKVFRGD